MAPDQILDLFSRLPPRSSQILWLRGIRGASSEDCAHFYGVEGNAVDVGVLRAVRDFLAGGEARIERGLSFQQETAQAAALSAALDGDSAIPAALGAELEILKVLRRDALELVRRFRERELAMEASPAQKRRELLRKVGISALIAVAFILFIRRGS